MAERKPVIVINNDLPLFQRSINYNATSLEYQYIVF